MFTKINNAKKQLEQGNANPAVNQMNLFVNIVSDLVSSGDLSPEFGDDLIAKATAIIVSIQN